MTHSNESAENYRDNLDVKSEASCCKISRYSKRVRI